MEYPLVNRIVPGKSRLNTDDTGDCQDSADLRDTLLEVERLFLLRWFEEEELKVLAKLRKSDRLMVEIRTLPNTLQEVETAARHAYSDSRRALTIANKHQGTEDAVYQEWYADLALRDGHRLSREAKLVGERLEQWKKESRSTLRMISKMMDRLREWRIYAANKWNSQDIIG